MKKTLVAIILAFAVLATCALPIFAAVPVMNWYDDLQCEVPVFQATVVEEGTIQLDAELDAAYLEGTKITHLDDDDYYNRADYVSAYAAIRDDGDARFFAYVAVDTDGMWIYAEIMDNTIFETTNSNGNDGDCFQIYFDWCTPDIVHPRPQQLRDMYALDGTGWNYGNYKSQYSVSGLQYIGWLSADYNGALSSSGGFSPHGSLGPDGIDPVGHEARLTDDGWACEWFVPWRDQEQKDMIAAGEQFHCGVGFQCCDDADIDNLCTPDKEENQYIRYPMTWSIGNGYYADYSRLPDIMWADDYPEGYFEGTYGGPETPTEDPAETSDSIFGIVAAIVVAGAGVVIFSKKKKI